MYLIIPHPETGKPFRIDNPTIMAVHENGTFDASGGGWSGSGCNPDVCKLYDDSGREIMPSVAPAMDGEMLKAMQILLGGEV